MPSIKINLNKATRRRLEQMLESARRLGDSKLMTRILAILLVSEGESQKYIASLLKVSRESVRLWVCKFLLTGPEGLRSKKSPGQKPRLTKTQKRKLIKMITDGPEDAGYKSACWRSPMVQDLIYTTFGVFYSTKYISELLKNLGLSYQKARFVSDHLNKEERQEWVDTKWPEIMRKAKEKNSYVLFGDEASFPQWGSLSYTWAPKGQQPIIKTSGKRKSYKVLGLIEYFTGRFFYQGHEGRLNSDTYIDFLKGVLRRTKKHIILIQDSASYHTSKKVEAFFDQHEQRLTVYQLPSYSPDYNPIEILWKD